MSEMDAVTASEAYDLEINLDTLPRADRGHIQIVKASIQIPGRMPVERFLAYDSVDRDVFAGEKKPPAI